MSYAFGMFFVECKKEDVLDKCQSVIDELMRPENARAYMKENSFYAAGNRYGRRLPEDFKYIAGVMNEYWLYSLFNVRFVYWEEFNLLALTGYDYPGNIEKMFTTHIGFQNSCDQDYEYNYWDGISAFEKIVEKVNSSSTEEIVKHLKDIGVWDDYDEDEKTYFLSNQYSIEYQKRSMVYHQIYDMLELDAWLYGNDGNFKRITLNGIETSEKRYELERELKVILKSEEYF